MYEVPRSPDLESSQPGFEQSAEATADPRRLAAGFLHLVEPLEVDGHVDQAGAYPPQVTAISAAEQVRPRVETECETEFLRIFDGHAFDGRMLFDFQLSGDGVPESIRARRIYVMTDSMRFALGPQATESEGSQRLIKMYADFADRPGVLVAGSGGRYVDNYRRYAGMPSDQILAEYGEIPDLRTHLDLAESLKACRHFEAQIPSKFAQTSELDPESLGPIGRMALEAKSLPYEPRVKAGPFNRPFSDILKYVGKELERIGEAEEMTLSPEIIVPPSYRTQTAIDQRNGLSTHGAVELLRLTDERRKRVTELARKEIAPLIAGQTIDPDVLAIPPYLRMDVDDQSCFNACFRMVFADITGELTSEFEVKDAMVTVNGHKLVPDEAYLKIFQTPTFRRMTRKAVGSVELFGADLDYISQYAKLVESKRAGAKVYALVSLRTESSSADKDTWHCGIITGADRDFVYVHDPTQHANRGRANRPIPKKDFAERWAATYNRGHLIIAA